MCAFLLVKITIITNSRSITFEILSSTERTYKIYVVKPGINMYYTKF